MTTPVRSAHARVVDTGRQQEPWRTDAQVDVDRLLYSAEFRRLAGVTQVVPPQDDFHFHDRLTHSIKVAQVAETLARMLLHNARVEPASDAFRGIKLDDWVNPSHCYAAGLAHDIGHPPFGHAGEEALQQLLEVGFEDDVDFWPDGEPHDVKSDSALLAARSFEGNAQSTRVIASLSVRGDDLLGGLNLTLRTLAAVAKYPWLHGNHPAGHDKLAKKWSFYREEAAILEELEKLEFIRVVKDDDGVVQRVDRWVEAEIMDWADDISYAVHDVDDFYRAGLIPLGQIAIALLGATAHVDWYTTDFDFVEDDEIRDCLKYISDKLKKFQQRQPADETTKDARLIFVEAFGQIRTFATDVCPRAPFTGTQQSHRDLHRFSSAIIGYLSDAATLVVDPDTQRLQLALDPTRVLVAEFFKAINSYFVVESVSLAAMQYGQVENLRSLFVAMFDLANEWMEKNSDGKISGRVPARLKAYLKTLADQSKDSAGKPRAPDAWQIAVAVLDYITSLRDVQAARLAAQLNGSREMSALSGAWLNT